VAAGKETVSDRNVQDSPFSDEAGRPIGEYQPFALERLNRLHNESVETARLADLFGRVPLAAGALGAGCAVLFILSAGSQSAILLGLWALSVGAAVLAMLSVARRAVSSPGELPCLRAFARHLHAVMLYAGLSWGAGAVIGITAMATTLNLLVFTIGGALVISIILRAKGAALYFLVPNIALAAAAALFGSAGAVAATAILMLGAVVAGAIALFERSMSRRVYAPDFPSLNIS
jgi:hypothetical protein